MRNTFKTALLLTLLSGVLLMIGQSLGGQNGLMFAFAIAVVMNFGSYRRRRQTHSRPVETLSTLRLRQRRVSFGYSTTASSKG